MPSFPSAHDIKQGQTAGQQGIFGSQVGRRPPDQQHQSPRPDGALLPMQYGGTATTTGAVQHQLDLARNAAHKRDAKMLHDQLAAVGTASGGSKSAFKVSLVNGVNKPSISGRRRR